MKLNSKLFGTLIFCAIMSSVGYSQTEENKTTTPTENPVHYSYNQEDQTYTFEVETEYKLIKRENDESIVLMKGTGSQVYLLNIPPGEYWMFKKDENGNHILDRFEIK